MAVPVKVDTTATDAVAVRVTLPNKAATAVEPAGASGVGPGEPPTTIMASGTVRETTTSAPASTVGAGGQVTVMVVVAVSPEQPSLTVPATTKVPTPSGKTAANCAVVPALPLGAAVRGTDATGVSVVTPDATGAASMAASYTDALGSGATRRTTGVPTTA